MPQMSPLWWLTLMISFNFIVMMTMNTMYFNYSINLKPGKMPNNKSFNWKW